MRTLNSLNAGSDSSTEDARSGCALPQQYALYFSACILQSLQFLWEKGISVNRMTTETVEVTEAQIPVLTDFLFASCCDPEERHVLSRQLHEVPEPWGDDSWPAPELLEISTEGGRHGRVDVWNLGSFVLMMSVGTDGFSHVREGQTDHRCGVSQASTAVAMQPCSQLATVSPCALAACSPDLLHLLSATMARSPCFRPTLRILQSLSYFAKVNFLNLHQQVAAYGLRLGELLGYAKSEEQLQQQPQQQKQAASEPGSRRTPQMKQLQMLEQMNDVDEILNRMGLQAVTVMENNETE